jgi:hypothetical protein
MFAASSRTLDAVNFIWGVYIDKVRLMVSFLLLDPKLHHDRECVRLAVDPLYEAVETRSLQ